jgi:hypothetical protein
MNKFGNMVLLSAVVVLLRSQVIYFFSHIKRCISSNAQSREHYITVTFRDNSRIVLIIISMSPFGAKSLELYHIFRKFVDPHVKVIFTLFGARNTEMDKFEREGTPTFERSSRIIRLGDSLLQDIYELEKSNKIFGRTQLLFSMRSKITLEGSIKMCPQSEVLRQRTRNLQLLRIFWYGPHPTASRRKPHCGLLTH